MARKDYPKALDAYTNAIKFNSSKDPFVYASRARAYSEIKSYDQAIADYTKAIELCKANPDFYQPDEAKYFHGRGYDYAQKGMIDQAIADFKRAVQLNPDDQDAKENIKKLQEDIH